MVSRFNLPPAVAPRDFPFPGGHTGFGVSLSATSERGRGESDDP